MSTLGKFWLDSVFEALDEILAWELWSESFIKKIREETLSDVDDKAIVETLTREIENNWSWLQVERDSQRSARDVVVLLKEESITIDEDGTLSRMFGDMERLCGYVYLGSWDNVCVRTYRFDDTGELMDELYRDALKEVGAESGGFCMVGVPDSGDVSYITEYKPGELEGDEDA